MYIKLQFIMHTSDIELIKHLLDQIEHRIGLIKENQENEKKFYKLMHLVTQLLCPEENIIT